MLRDETAKKLDEALAEMDMQGYKLFGFIVGKELDVEAVSSSPCSPEDFAMNVAACLQTEFPDVVFVDAIEDKGMVN